MAKGIEINGQLRGKRGGIVYYRAGGQQVSRARNFAPNNPRTVSQMLQRLALANASKASKGLKEIIDHSFEGIRYGVDSVRYFESKAQMSLKAAFTGGSAGNRYCAYVPMDALGFPVAEFLVSSGSLPSAKGAFERRGGEGGLYIWKADKKLPEGVTTANITPRQFCECLGVRTDAQLTFVHCMSEDSVGGAGSEIIFLDNILHSIVRINFDQSKLDEPMLVGSAIKPSVVVSEKSQNIELYEVVINGTDLSLMSDEDFSAAALIVSCFADGVWQRSTEKLTIAAVVGATGEVEDKDSWGWNWYDEIVKSLFKGAAIAEDYLLNKEDNE